MAGPRYYDDRGLARNKSTVSNNDIGKRLLNVTEAAQYLGLQVDTVYKKARLRELPFVKVGRALRFDVKALERFVEQHTIQPID
ncbi:MAG TPA: helix-turn-helix domain-containing protein [Bryobacteraceae bacterium]|nr:helix-turn-helix domain-containing protein [Bryobacteraceae bacterium]